MAERVGFAPSPVAVQVRQRYSTITPGPTDMPWGISALRPVRIPPAPYAKSRLPLGNRLLFSYGGEGGIRSVAHCRTKYGNAIRLSRRGLRTCLEASPLYGPFESHPCHMRKADSLSGIGCFSHMAERVGFAPSPVAVQNTATLFDYHAGAYGHALGHLRFTARSNPTHAICEKPTPSRESAAFLIWRRGWDSNPRTPRDA